MRTVRTTRDERDGFDNNAAMYLLSVTEQFVQSKKKINKQKLLVDLEICRLKVDTIVCVLIFSHCRNVIKEMKTNAK